MVEIFENIRKIYTFREPCDELADHIEFFSQSSYEDTKRHIAGGNFSVKMFPSWTPTFYINLGAPYEITVGIKRYFIKATEDILILRDTIVERFNTPLDNIFTVKFYPGGLEAVLNVKQPKLADQVINLNSILPERLLERLKQPISFDERVEILQAFFLMSYKKKGDYYLDFVKDTIDVYAGTGMQFNNSLIAEKMFTTSKTINRYFLRVVGTPPKNYFSAVRARAALTAYVKNSKQFVPFDYGYYDMSHFYKDVVKFTGEKLTVNK